MAAKEGNLKIIKILLKYGADGNKIGIVKAIPKNTKILGII